MRVTRQVEEEEARHLVARVEADDHGKPQGYQQAYAAHKKNSSRVIKRLLASEVRGATKVQAVKESPRVRRDFIALTGMLPNHKKKQKKKLALIG